MSELVVPTMAELIAKEEKAEVLFWVGCAGSFDDRAKKITKVFVKLLNKANVKFAVLELKKVVVVTLQDELETNFYSKCKPWQILKS